MSAIVVVGAGMAGLSCAREFRKLDSQTSLTIVTQDRADVYSKPMLSNVLAKSLSVAKLVTATKQQTEESLSISILSEQTVTSIDSANKRLLMQGQSIEYDKLVLAVGARQRDAGIHNPDSVKLFQINHLNDYVQFKQALGSAKHVGIIGSGLIGCEFANDLASVGVTSTVIGPGKYPLANLIPAALAERLQQRLAEQGIQWLLGHKVNSLRQGADALELVLDDGQVQVCDLVLSAVGLEAELGLAKQAGLETRRGIVVNDYLQSSDSDIFALGDCAEIQGRVLPFILPIMYGARSIAASLNGTPTKVVYPIMPVVVKTPACPLCVLPVDRDEVGQWQVSGDSNGMSAVFKAPDDTIKGFALLGEAMSQRQLLVKQMNQQHQ